MLRPDVRFTSDPARFPGSHGQMKKLALGLASILILIATFAIVVSIGLVHDQRNPAPEAPTAIAQVPPAPISVEGVYILPDDGPQPLIDELDAAHSSISIEIYLLTDDSVISALFRARDRGVLVRVLLEEDPYGGSNQQQEVFDTLTAANIEVRWNAASKRFSHVKLVVVDDRVALIMNLNLTYSGLNRNRELAIITNDPDLVDHAARVFETDWLGTAGPIPGPLVLSPDNSREVILGMVASAQVSIDIYAEVIADKEFIEYVGAALARGVRVRIVMTEGYNQNLMDEPVGELVRAGAELHKLDQPYIHAKMLLIDGQSAMIGSQNFTYTSMNENREVGAVISGSTNIERLLRTFERDFASGIPVSDPPGSQSSDAGAVSHVAQ